MDVEELMTRAWKAVESAGIPEPLQEIAFRKALEVLSDEPTPRARVRPPGGNSNGNGRGSTDVDDGDGSATDVEPDTQDFYKRLSFESGVAETDLQDVLYLSGAKVHVAVPAKDLGKNTAEQAKAVIVLVSSARSKGLGESPVDGTEVRNELKRMSCYQQNNYKTGHLGPLKGFNAGPGREDIVVNSRWVEEFKATVAKALGRPAES